MKNPGRPGTSPRNRLPIRRAVDDGGPYEAAGPRRPAHHRNGDRQIAAERSQVQTAGRSARPPSSAPASRRRSRSDPFFRLFQGQFFAGEINEMRDEGLHRLGPTLTWIGWPAMGKRQPEKPGDAARLGAGAV